MGKETGIAWCDHTFNAWHGCEKVSPACTNCYAEAQSKRYGFHIWGKTAPRRFFGPKHWNEPHRWDIEAKVDGVRRRVFVNSMSDTFEDRPDLVTWRLKLFDLIQDCRGLDWLLLTKRPQNARRMVPLGWLKDPPANVWFGTTVENQEEAEKRIPELVKIPARVRFLSCEPLLGPVDLSRYLFDPLPKHQHFEQIGCDCNPELTGDLHWVIAGGESGAAPRYTEPAWIESLIDQGRGAGAAVFVKQLGTAFARKFRLTSTKAAEPWEWPGHLRVQQFPKIETKGAIA